MNLNSIKTKFMSAEKTAVEFTLHALEATLCGYALLLVHLVHNLSLEGVAYFAELFAARGASEYLLCSFFLSIACGFFLNAAIKSERRKNG